RRRRAWRGRPAAGRPRNGWGGRGYPWREIADSASGAGRLGYPLAKGGIVPNNPLALLPSVIAAAAEAGRMVAEEFHRPSGPRFSDHVTAPIDIERSEEHTSELQSRSDL